MKFKGVMCDNLAMREFMNISNSLIKFAKTCILKLTETQVQFIICEEETGPTRPLVWYDLPINYYFNEYEIQGLNDEFNEIYLEFSTELLARSVSVLKLNVRKLKIKLKEKEYPCLSLEMELIPEEVQNRQCVHDIKVQIISRKYWKDYDIPTFNDYHITISLPPIKRLKNIIERMNHISDRLTLIANKNGRVILKVKTDTVEISAHFLNLSLESFAVANDDGDTQVDTVETTIDIKKFSMFLTGLQFENGKTFCSIVNNHMVKLEMIQGTLNLQILLTELND